MKQFASYITFLLLVFSSAKAQERIDFYFKTGKATFEPVEQNRLEQFIQKNTTVKIVSISGFTDEVGAAQANNKLAKARVQTVVDILNNRILTRTDFRTNNFGEKFAQGLGENALNRKVSILYLKEADIPREEEILGLKPKSPEPVAPVVPTSAPKFPESLRFKNIDGSVSEFSLDTLAMKSIYEARVGEKLKLKNLEFKINTFIIEPRSHGALYELLTVMQAKPSLKIQIQGHICCMPNDSRDLSTQRAKAIANFLQMNGIDKSRLSYKGLGVTQPIYPIPEKNEEERATNRRVEFEIIAN
ncbi:OmpA family protein [Flavobacterium sp.]|uniref:OmpA family protein n=1 Tax=Flavobacterium sp. TaxID=239 RepID=UPI003B9D5E38